MTWVVHTSYFQKINNGQTETDKVTLKSNPNLYINFNGT